MVNFSIGADPEMFLMEDGNFVSALGRVPGTKEYPTEVGGGMGWVQVDGTAVEFNTIACPDGKTFSDNVRFLMDTIEVNTGCKIYEGCTVDWGQQLYTFPEEAIELGCSPDYNAWTSTENPRPDGTNTTLRTAGGHVHVGMEGLEDRGECERLVRLMDYHIGLPSLMWDNDKQRRTLYGRAGAYRPKIYGLEYRTLSNAWLFKPEILSNMYSMVKNAVKDWELGLDASEEVEQIINSSDVEAARKLIGE